jgi:hypothetical protein
MPEVTRPQAGERKGEHEAFIATWLDQVRRNPELPGNAFNDPHADPQRFRKSRFCETGMLKRLSDD